MTDANGAGEVALGQEGCEPFNVHTLAFSFGDATGGRKALIAPLFWYLRQIKIVCRGV
jgi:hypothetical protein